jgi:hypothetical protein
MTKNDDFKKNPFDGSPPLRQLIPISAAITIILMMVLFHNCRADKNENRPVKSNQTIFTYVDKKTLDTTKFYGYKDLDTALYEAKKEKKNILLVFSGYACMDEGGKEWKTLSAYGDNNKIQDNFIIAWLAVDDNRTAKDTNQIVSWYGKDRKLISVGDQNKYYEEKTFLQSTVPLFCFIDNLKKPFGKILNYTSVKTDIDDFINSGLTK